MDPRTFLDARPTADRNWPNGPRRRRGPLVHAAEQPHLRPDCIDDALEAIRAVRHHRLLHQQGIPVHVDVVVWMADDAACPAVRQLLVAWFLAYSRTIRAPVDHFFSAVSLQQLYDAPMQLLFDELAQGLRDRAHRELVAEVRRIREAEFL